VARKMALSAVGRDCPGIVAAVSQALFERGCNIEDSSMTILRGEFAMILIVSVPEDADIKQLEDRLKAAETDLSLFVSLKELPKEEGERVHQEHSYAGYIVSVYGADRPGIVYRVTRLLADCQVNITDVNTRVVGEGKPVYIMILEVEAPRIPESLDLEQRLESLGKELSVDITIRPLETANL
jgi:glycine cleavage system transcriptional repressor